MLCTGKYISTSKDNRVTYDGGPPPEHEVYSHSSDFNLDRLRQVQRRFEKEIPSLGLWRQKQRLLILIYHDRDFDQRSERVECPVEENSKGHSKAIAGGGTGIFLYLKRVLNKYERWVPVNVRFKIVFTISGTSDHTFNVSRFLIKLKNTGRSATGTSFLKVQIIRPPLP